MLKSNLLNLIALSLMQAANALTPLMIFPFALATVGSDAYSALVTTEAASIIISVFVIYSFEIDGQAMMARLKSGLAKSNVSEIFSRIFYARLSIFAAATIISLPIAWMTLEARLAGLFTLWLGLPLSYALQPNWLFQAIEKNLGVAIIVIISRLAAVSIVLLKLTDAKDVMLIPATIASCYVIGAILSLVYIKAITGLRFKPFYFREIYTLLLDGRHIFLGNLSVALYREINVLVLGVVGVASSAVAAYSLAEKIVKGLQATIRPLNQLFFPKALLLLSRKSAPEVDALRILWRLLYPQLLVLLFFCFVAFIAGIYFFSEEFNIKNTPNEQGVFSLIMVMLPAIFFGVANFMLGSAGLNYLGQKKYMMKSIFYAGIISFGACVLLASALGALGAGLSFLFAEVFLFFLVIRRYVCK